MERKGSRGKKGKERKKSVRPTLAHLTKVDRFLKLASRKVLRLDAGEFEVPEWRESAAGLAQASQFVVESP